MLRYVDCNSTLRIFVQSSSLIRFKNLAMTIVRCKPVRLDAIPLVSPRITRDGQSYLCSYDKLSR